MNCPSCNSEMIHCGTNDLETIDAELNVDEFVCGNEECCVESVNVYSKTQ